MGWRRTSLPIIKTAVIPSPLVLTFSLQNFRVISSLGAAGVMSIWGARKVNMRASFGTLSLLPRAVFRSNMETVKFSVAEVIPFLSNPPFVMHPVSIDCSFQMTFFSGPQKQPYLPVAFLAIHANQIHGGNQRTVATSDSLSPNDKSSTVRVYG